MDKIKLVISEPTGVVVDISEVPKIEQIRVLDGVPGKSGRDGQRGEPGLEGKSAYTIAVENGFIGSESDWLNSLKGGGAVYNADSYLEFPTIGDEHIIYIDKSNNKIYRFNSNELKYYIIGSDYSDIKIIDGGR